MFFPECEEAIGEDEQAEDKGGGVRPDDAPDNHLVEPEDDADPDSYHDNDSH